MVLQKLISGSKNKLKIIMKIKILYVTQTLGYKASCGIGLMGDLIGKTLVEHPEFHVELLYSDSVEEMNIKLDQFKPDIAIYNYSPGSTPWLTELPFSSSSVKHVKIMHDMHQGIADTYQPEFNGGWEYVISDDPTVIENDRVFITNRLLPATPTITYTETNIPIIGFQGFGPPHKGIHRIAEQVVKEFNEAIIRLHIPFGFYGDPHGDDARKRVEEVQQIVSHKPNIKVIASHNLLSTQEIVNWLAQNTINCYFYDYLDGAGLASSPDYAIAAKRPIAVTKSHQMRHFWNLNPSILIENNSLKQIINNGTKSLEIFYKTFSKESVLFDYTRIINKILKG